MPSKNLQAKNLQKRTGSVAVEGTLSELKPAAFMKLLGQAEKPVPTGTAAFSSCSVRLKMPVGV